MKLLLYPTRGDHVTLHINSVVASLRLDNKMVTHKHPTSWDQHHQMEAVQRNRAWHWLLCHWCYGGKTWLQWSNMAAVHATYQKQKVLWTYISIFTGLHENQRSTTQIVYSPQYSNHIGRREVVTSANRRATTWHCMKCDVLLCHAGMLGGIQSVTVKKVPLHVLINNLQYEKHTTNRHLSLQSLQTIHLLPILNCSSIIYTLETTMFTADRHIEAWTYTLIL